MGSASFFLRAPGVRENRVPAPAAVAICHRRRRWGLTAACGLIAWAVAPTAWAGAQREEELGDSVRTALSAAVAERAPPGPLDFADTQARMAHLRWRAAVGARLQPRMADDQTRDEFLLTLWYEVTRAGLEPALVLGLIEVESDFRKYAVSSAGARGYMQVMPFWARTIGDGEAARLFHLQTNLRFGCVILRHYLNLEQGDLFMALGRYNGSRGQPAYPQAVLAARRRWLV
ncbi:MAG: lytic transglycosylase domain-containing protein [Betaproteobacteria bacterium]|nr:lytic transglycosylase domain-containing protein [Betaproteobacteria bacterium]NBT11129.1 lytic transglycosylase domain-containing protein [Betaproteobacteria bacterium]NBU50628.1 lytic transglycosylase domain-containing protein [Betaproteobacteria bacterium]